MICSVGPKLLKHPKLKHLETHIAKLAAKPKAAGSFDVPVTPDGLTPHVAVYVDDALDQASAAALVKTLLPLLEPAYQANAAYYKGIATPVVNLVIFQSSPNSDGTGGAYHYGCDFASGGTLYCDASFADPLSTLGLFIAELDECFQGDASNPNPGWGCGFSNGEAHSRVAAELASGGPNGSLAAYTSAPVWQQDGDANWIDTTEQTDQDYDSIGCGMAFLSWLGSLKFSFAQITQAAAPTLAGVYQKLTGKTTASADFAAALKGVVIDSDDPFKSDFGGATPPAPPAPPPPAPPPAPPPPPTPPPAVIGPQIFDAAGNLAATFAPTYTASGPTDRATFAHGLLMHLANSPLLAEACTATHSEAELTKFRGAVAAVNIKSAALNWGAIVGDAIQLILDVATKANWGNIPADLLALVTALGA